MALSFLSTAIQPLASFATAPILAQTLGPEGRGQMAAAIAPASLVIAGMTLGLPEAATYFTARRGCPEWHVLKRTLWITIAVSIASAVGLILFAPKIVGENSELAALVQLGAIGIPFGMTTGLMRAFCAGLGLWKLIALEGLLSSSSRLIGIAIIASTGELDPRRAVAVVLASQCIGLPLLFIATTRRLDRQLPAQPSRVLGYGLGVWLGAVSGVLLTSLDQAMMAALSTPRELGIYATAVSCAILVSIFNAAIRGVIFTKDSASSDPALILRAATVSTAVTSALAVVLAVAAPVAVPLVFGGEFRGSIIVIWILLVAAVLGNPGSVAGAGLLSRGRPFSRSSALLASALINVSLIFALVPPLGALGAALAMLGAQPVAGFLCIVLFTKLERSVRIRDFYRLDIRTAIAILFQVWRGFRRKGMVRQ